MSAPVFDVPLSDMTPNQALNEMRKERAAINFLRISLDHQLEEAKSLLAEANVLLERGYNGINFIRLDSFRKRYENFLESTKDEVKP